MEIIGGLDLHRKQITFDYLSTATGELSRGKIVPATRQEFRQWLTIFELTGAPYSDKRLVNRLSNEPST